MDLVLEYRNLKRNFLESEFSHLNKEQKEAVFRVKGQVMVVAGAGSGKTTVIINRILNMLSYGNLYLDESVPKGLNHKLIYKMENVFEDKEKIEEIKEIEIDKINPENILAITFTNKSAKELQIRLEAKMGKQAKDVLASTFHSFCVRILRQHAEKIGFSNDFTIYDTEDTRKMIKECQRDLGIDDKVFPIKNNMSAISKAKDELVSHEDFKERHQTDFKFLQVSQIYEMYQTRIKYANAMDFDDLIFNTVLLFNSKPEVLKFYQDKFKYVMVDEYQDTNYAQHVLVSKLIGKNGNLCIVGDDDQSIYKFRGAVVENMLDFEKQYENAHVIRLEQNYRSTKNILIAANSIISNNSGRKEKVLWTDNPKGNKIKLHTAFSEHDEVNVIVNEIKKRISLGANYSDFAVLYRMSSQSNVIERIFSKSGIPYKMLGGVRFFERKEVKDLISYFNVINNTGDEIRLRRIINRPKRSMGDRTINLITSLARENNKTMYDVMKDFQSYPDLNRCCVKITEFLNVMESLIKSYKKGSSLVDLYHEILDRTKYIDFLQQENDEVDNRVSNIKELASAVARYEKESENPSLSGFLEEVSLEPDKNVDGNKKNATGEVVLATIHASKGLEFPVVFLPGFEEEIFPGIHCNFQPEDVEEERRLAYVAATRAKNELFILCATSRMIFGSTSHNRPSRFLSEIPEEIIVRTKSQEWTKVENEEKTSSSYDIRVKSVISARNFGVASNSIISQNMEDLKRDVFSPGEDIIHEVLGRGKIISVVPKEMDSLLEIDFEKFGTKRIFSRFAKLRRESLR
ncbi:MAG: UvrD-helicase domain-containing protein [Candidatus Improbicoccus pseudotrichonymphae]|uniref:DNA 3'-5' helicase n=1 Tax=Candidatus Improbicoccus pseudotrichonymphae TaxID=3033792 RepID=A0AA48L0L8_9FIRM|nr:MAG: UvrD-helicase domain-containing protein [Candidatus Improbicoccus pseudotrichonymphae]